MFYLAIILVVGAFVGGWWYTARTLKDMGPLFPHLLGFPIGFVLMFCTLLMCHFFGLLTP